MLILLSPAKDLDYQSPTPKTKHTTPIFLDDSQQLVDQLKTLAPHQLSHLMGISDKLGTTNFGRFQSWSRPFTKTNARQAIFAFNGDVYGGLNAYAFNDDELVFAQAHLRILSGLYGVLRPLDLMQPYRLEMGTRLTNSRGKDLYAFWGDRISKELNKQVKKLGDPVLVNLASTEYFKSVDKAALQAEVITPVFKDWKGDQFKIISFFAKKARGLMSAYIIKNRVTDVEKIKRFDWEGYAFDASLSNTKEWVFTRKQS